MRDSVQDNNLFLASFRRSVIVRIKWDNTNVTIQCSFPPGCPDAPRKLQPCTSQVDTACFASEKGAIRIAAARCFYIFHVKWQLSVKTSAHPIAGMQLRSPPKRKAYVCSPSYVESGGCVVASRSLIAVLYHRSTAREGTDYRGLKSSAVNVRVLPYSRPQRGPSRVWEKHSL